MNPLNRQWFYRGLRRRLVTALGRTQADTIWDDAGKEYQSMLSGNAALKKHKGAMVLPAVALYRVLTAFGADAEDLLNGYGDAMGRRFARIVHCITSVPVDSIMNRMSGENLGYQRRIVSEPPEMFGVDILSCPYHELARELGNEKAVLCICHMDKAYMQGFRHIRYERTTAVSEGAECCDYRLRFDPEKK